MEQWEYKVAYLCHRDTSQMAPFKPGEEMRGMWELDLEKQLNKLGADGWELADFPSDILGGKHLDGFALFKRRKVNP